MFSLTLHSDAYPQRRDWQDLPWLDRLGEGLRVRLGARLRLRAGRRAAVAVRVEAEEERLAQLSPAERQAELAELKRALRRDGFDKDAEVWRVLRHLDDSAMRLIVAASAGLQQGGAGAHSGSHQDGAAVEHSVHGGVSLGGSKGGFYRGLFGQAHLGISTVSIAWITPLLAATSVAITLDWSTITPMLVETVSSCPCTVLTLPALTSLAMTLPGTTW